MSKNLDSSIQFLAGVGPKMAAKLNKLGIKTVSDLIFYYPRAYIDFLKITKIADIKYSNKEAITVKGKIVEIANKKTSRKKFTVTEAIIEDKTASIKVVWFNQPFLAKMLKKDREIYLNGKISYNFFSREVVMESPERAFEPAIIPIYGETSGLTSRYVGKLISNIKFQTLSIKEWLPENLLKKYRLANIHSALLNIHFPKNLEMLESARRRIAFDELFLISLRANLSKLEIKKEIAPRIEIEEKNVIKFVEKLPFKLTSDQKKTAKQILSDVGKKVPMNRLLNGDVGSGKTVVAAIAAFAAVENNFKVAVMAPTEILANQHFETFKKMFPRKSLGIMTAAKKEVFSSTKIFIGTQALIQKGVEIDNMGLVIVDEQHRFGVVQRSALQDIGKINGFRSHFLSMTATPIPRTLHLALFGDLDISIIGEKPKNRKEVKTRFVEPQNREKAYEFVRKHLKAGHQCFVICPLIENDSKENYSLFDEERKSVKAEFAKLQKIFPEFKIEILHGKLKSKEKNEIMKNFAANKINILVSTSVVEVGIDVPNATVMMVEDAERFGLAQLHQFRGRVGRAEHQSFCFLLSSTISEKATQRLKAFESISDGFKLAEIDLQTRGPGAVFGTEQSGLLDLKMADFSDKILIKEASEAAKSIVEKDPELKNHPQLKNKIADFLNNKHLE